MATMFPRDLPREVRDAPERAAECALFDACREQLPGEYCVFYSVAWLGRSAVNGAWDGEADFVIAHPERGIVVVEVKGGFIRRDGESGQWYSTTRGARKEYAIKDPVSQARRSKYHLAAKLESLPRWVAGKPKLAHAIAFPHCERYEGPLTADCPREIVIYAADTRDLKNAVRRIYDYWAGSTESCSALDSTAMSAVISMLAPSVELRPAPRSIGAEVASAEAQIAALTANQTRVLKALVRNRRVAISGGAGTGKTMLALAKAKSLAEQGFRTLLTCYNRPLADYLRYATHGCPGLEVADFHQFCMATIGAAGLSVGRPEGAKYWEEIVPNALVEALSNLPDGRFDAVIVDEAQDFAEGWWVPLQLALREPDRGILYVFYDDNQKLYQRANSFPSGLVDFCLCENLRNTQEIHHAAARFYAGGELIGAGPSGSAVDFVLAADSGTQKRAVGKVIDALVRGGVKPSDIAVLTGRAVQTSRVAVDGRFGSARWTRDQSADPDMTLLESISRFKGLERPVVILVELEDHVSAERDDTIYVGLSRARSSLTVVGSADVLGYVRSEVAAPAGSGATDYLKALLGEG